MPDQTVRVDPYGMRPSKPIILLVAIVTGALLVFCATYRLAAVKAASDIRAAGERQLQIIALDLASILEKFETLPFALGFQADVRQALEHPDDQAVIQRLNAALKTIQRQSKVVSIYMMDRNGKTLASSNWDQAISFIGRDFGFRPYFREAMRGGAGRFYGIGNASSEPGYFIAQPIYRLPSEPGKGAPIGVMAVKVDLSEFEHTWRSSDDPITLVDHSGVVFLSNRSAWKYHSLQPLDPGMQQELAGTHQYADRIITPVSTMPPAMRSGFGEHIERNIERQGWRLMLFPSQQRIHRVALLWSMWVGLLIAVAVISIWALYQRRRRLQEQIESRDALRRAAEELDAMITVRTEELMQANRDIETKYGRLKQTESLLRTTQNELVQAGKLTMLGQMAGGVTHELSQPLAAIRAFADNAVKFLARGQPGHVEENLQHISEASAHMGKIIAQLRGFARKNGETIAPVDLQKSIEAATLLLRNEFEQRQVQLLIEIADQVQIVGDAVRTEQVLLNLLRNALEAVDTADRKEVSVRLTRAAGMAVITIHDSGPGIDARAAEHLFEPFFTTKSSSKGLGLGLAISSSIVQAMDGQLSARNHAGGGAEFVVRLPVTQE